MSYITRNLLEATATESYKSAIKIAASSSQISGVFTIQSEDAVDGFWLYFGGEQQGLTPLTIEVEAAVVPTQDTWFSIDSVSFGQGLATNEPAEATLLVKPAADSILPPYLRLVFTAAAGCTAKFTDIIQTRRD